MKYCVLGGGGSFGLHLSRYLLGTDAARVIGVGRSPPKPECFTLGVGDGDSRYSYHAFHIYHEQDMLLDFLDRERPDVIVNFAAQGESAASFRHSWRYFETNCVALMKLVEHLQQRMWLKKFVHIGTSELYGPTDGPASEDAPLNPTSYYAISKATFDAALVLAASRGFPMNIVRPSNCYGEGQQLWRVIPKAVLFGLAGRKLPLHGGGKAEKSYMHNFDLACAIWKVIHDAPPGRIYNAGPDRPIAIRDMVENVARALNMSMDQLCEIVPDRDHNDSRYWLDSTAMRNEFNWRPVVGLDEGLDRMVAWGRRYLDQLALQPTEFVMRA